MLVCVFSLLWSAEVYFEGACNRNLLSAWAEAREALQVSSVEDALLGARDVRVQSAAAPGAEEHRASWTAGPLGALVPGAGPRLPAAFRLLFLGCVAFPAPVRIPGSSLAPISVTCPGLPPSGHF